MSQPSINPHGAVDLSALAQRPAPATRDDGLPTGDGAMAGGVVVDVTEADFQSVIEQSDTVPVVLDFWADWCGPCKHLSPILERLAVEADGRWLLAKVDVDANQRLGAAFQVQSIPSVFALVKGQPVPLFQGALPEPQVRQYLDELLQVAAANGVTGRIEAGAVEDVTDEPEPAVASRYDQAYDAIERGDFDAAAVAYQSLLDESPADADAKAGLAQVDLLRRATALDPVGVRRAAGERPDDVQAQLDAADLEMLDGAVEDAFSRLVELVRRTSGEDRDKSRAHLLDLFEVAGGQDDRVVKARTALANALF